MVPNSKHYIEIYTKNEMIYNWHQKYPNDLQEFINNFLINTENNLNIIRQYIAKQDYRKILEITIEQLDNCAFIGATKLSFGFVSLNLAITEHHYEVITEIFDNLNIIYTKTKNELLQIQQQLVHTPLEII